MASFQFVNARYVYDTSVAIIHRKVNFGHPFALTSATQSQQLSLSLIVYSTH